ncbi:uncharacterized protein [Clytia hemisphaerica]|uniref:Uncharacterized protein n=1 Tax=Clytia hemisphaerica TaxID=252671 RepID=A0A7M6DRR3_9CNID|eukprot:TCONS_00062878-protein
MVQGEHSTDLQFSQKVSSQYCRLETRNGSRNNERQNSRVSNSSSRNCSTASEPGYISGERISNGNVRTLSALYRPTFQKFPTFPSIYQTKYQNDFKYIPFPIASDFKPQPVRSIYTEFKFGTSSYCQQYQMDHADLKIKQWQRKPLPTSRHRHNNPHPSLKLVQNHPQHARWSWSRLEDHRSAQSSTNNEHQKVKYHRWNSR